MLDDDRRHVASDLGGVGELLFDRAALALANEGVAADGDHRAPIHMRNSVTHATATATGIARSAPSRQSAPEVAPHARLSLSCACRTSAEVLTSSASTSASTRALYAFRAAWRRNMLETSVVR